MDFSLFSMLITRQKYAWIAHESVLHFYRGCPDGPKSLMAGVFAGSVPMALTVHKHHLDTHHPLWVWLAMLAAFLFALLWAQPTH